MPSHLLQQLLPGQRLCVVPMMLAPVFRHVPFVTGQRQRGAGVTDQCAVVPEVHAGLKYQAVERVVLKARMSDHRRALHHEVILVAAHREDVTYLHLTQLGLADIGQRLRPPIASRQLRLPTIVLQRQLHLRGATEVRRQGEGATVGQGLRNTQATDHCQQAPHACTCELAAGFKRRPIPSLKSTASRVRPALRLL
ncbi:hypothetical protein D9M71_522450 [compost metagenome]